MKMALTIELPEIKKLLEMTDARFAAFATQSLLSHQIYAPSFNKASGASLTASLTDKIYLLSFDRQPFVRAAIEVLNAYDHSRKISIALREKFLIAYTKDRLRQMAHTAPDTGYRQFYEETMAKVTGQMKSIGSLVWMPHNLPRAGRG